MKPIDPAETFQLEAADLLEQIETIVLQLEEHPDDMPAIHQLFRAFHTLKGSGAMFGFDAVAAFTHHVETALDEVRDGRRPITGPLLSLLLSARDQIHVLLRDGNDAAANTECARIISELGTASPAGAGTSDEVGSAGVNPDAAIWRIHFKPVEALAVRGADPLALLDELRRLGSAAVTIDTTALPEWSQFNPEHCYLAWDIHLTTSRGLNEIKDVFIFVEDACELAITPFVVASAPIGREPSKSAAVSAESTSGSDQRKAADSTVRVPSSKLDRLVNLVGEFVMNQSRLAQVATKFDSPELAGPVEAIERLVDELRDNVLGIRMMPIGSTFSRFKRLVRDLSLELGKEITLVTEGGDTELDKTVLDQLGDPLVHLIRNSLDHGIEKPDDRIRAGKPTQGTIRLTAAHAGSHVAVTIQDDGRGLDTQAIRAKAIEKGLLTADAPSSDREIFNLIFLPGFSTAREVTNISGRGVGMDVVRRQVESLRGEIQIDSVRGAGTTITLRLPLTLAIIDGLLVQLGESEFILPMADVMENVELTRADRHLRNGRNVVAVRGELIPFVRLRELFTVGGDGPELEKVVIVRHGGERFGIVVDRVLGSHQTVIQSLGRFYRDVEVCSGSTIMGDGHVALILDLPGLLQHAARGNTANHPAAA